MKARVAFREAALQDVRDILAHFAGARAGVGERFIDALEAATRCLRDHPESGHLLPSRIPSLAGLRTWPVPGFPDILLVTLADRRRVSILRVVHGARDLPRLLAPEEE